jgi:hypothetical protein
MQSVAVAFEHFSFTIEHDCAFVQEDRSICEFQGHGDMLLDQDYRVTLACCKLLEDFHQHFADYRRQAFQRLVKEEHGRARICCSPPESCVPPMRRRSFRRGNKA